MRKWISNIWSGVKQFFTTSKKAPKVHIDTVPPNKKEDPLTERILWHSLMLGDDECLVYIDEDKVVHYITRQPFDEEKDYRIILLTESDI